MTYETILRTVQVGLNQTGGGVSLAIDMDQYDINQNKAQILEALKKNIPDQNAEEIYETYRRYYVVTPSKGSPLDVISNGPTVFLYVVDAESANNWRFRTDEASGAFMARKANAKLSPEEFAKNFGQPFEIVSDDMGVTMYGIYDNCTDYDEPGSEPHCIFGFDIFMKIIQGDKVTNITIDPDTGNGGGGTRTP